MTNECSNCHEPSGDDQFCSAKCASAYLREHPAEEGNGPTAIILLALRAQHLMSVCFLEDGRPVAVCGHHHQDYSSANACAIEMKRKPANPGEVEFEGRRGPDDTIERRLAWHHHKNKGPLRNHLNECVPTRPEPSCPCGLANPGKEETK